MPLATQPQPPLISRCPGLSSHPTFHGVEKAAAAWKRGAFLQDDDAGRLSEAVSPISAAAVTGRAFGMANHDAVGVLDTPVAFGWLSPLTIFEITLSDATAGNLTLAQTHMWKVYPILKATNFWYLDGAAVSDTGGGLVVGFKDPIGTVNPRVFAMLTSTARGGANAASGVF